MGLDDGDVIFSVHAIGGNQGIKTIKIFGSHKDRELLMLTYSGSRNGFINVKYKWIESSSGFNAFCCGFCSWL